MNFDLGEYASYIGPAYAVTAVALVGVTLWTVAAWRAARAKLAALEKKIVKRAIYILPIAGFALLAFFLFRSLWSPPPDIIPSALLDKPAPRLALPALDAQSAAFTSDDLRAGHVTVVNVFASWCAPCRTEAPALMALSRVPGVALYGLTQKDKPEATRAFLDEVGNPFARIARDDDGRASIEWGVYGVPETYVVDGKGVLRFKYVGGLTQAVLEQQLLPAIKSLQH